MDSKQIPFGNDRQKSKSNDKCNRRSFGFAQDADLWEQQQILRFAQDDKKSGDARFPIFVAEYCDLRYCYLRIEILQIAMSKMKGSRKAGTEGAGDEAGGENPVSARG